MRSYRMTQSETNRGLDAEMLFTPIMGRDCKTW